MQGIMTMKKSDLLTRIRAVQKELDELVDLVLSLDDTPEIQPQIIHDDDDWLTVKQVCMKMGISESTFYAALKDGLIPQGLAISPRCKRWRLSDIRAWQTKQKNEIIRNDTGERHNTHKRRGRTSHVRKINEFCCV